MTVWKFTLNLADLQGVEMPVGARLLHVAGQFETVCVWAEVDAGATREVRMFQIVGTGNPRPSDGSYVGTAMMRGGEFVWHVYEVAA